VGASTYGPPRPVKGIALPLPYASQCYNLKEQNMSQYHDTFYTKENFFLKRSGIIVFLSKVEDAIVQLRHQTPLTRHLV
jgi:hypothetical protein